MEDSYHTFLTPTGFGAVFLCLFSVLRPGNEIIIADPVYSPTRTLTENFLNEFIFSKADIFLNLSDNLKYCSANIYAGNKDFLIKMAALRLSPLSKDS